ILLGPESAGQILKSFEPQELEAIAGEMSRLPVITAEVREAILTEMSEVAMAASHSVRGGVEFTQSALSRAVGSNKATDILGRVSRQRGPSKAVQRMMELEPRYLLNLLKEEQPQTIALVLSHLRPEKASELIGLLKPEQRDPIVERIATLG